MDGKRGASVWGEEGREEDVPNVLGLAGTGGKEYEDSKLANLVRRAVVMIELPFG